MGLMSCRWCSSRMGLLATRCPRCGRKKDRAKLAILALIAVQVCIIGAYIEWGWHHGSHGVRHVGLARSSSQEDVPPVSAGWFYFETADTLLDDVTRHARLLSDSNPGGGNPNDHGTLGVLELRSSPHYGNSVLITTRRAPFDTADEQFDLKAKIDDGDVTVFQASAMVEGDSDVLILADYAGFVTKLQSGKVLVLDAQLSRGTERVLHFDVGGLKWQ